MKQESRDFPIAKEMLERGDTALVQREWARVSAREQGRDKVRDNHELRVAVLWGEHLMKEKKWPEAQEVWKRALGATQGLVTERMNALFFLVETLMAQDKVEELHALLYRHPLIPLIERVSQTFPGSQQGARLANLRFDYSTEARLLRKAFETSPAMPDELRETLRATAGKDQKQWRDIALTHYLAGEISLAIEAEQQAFALAATPLQQVGALCKTALWRRAREGWETIEPLVAQAETLAMGSLPAEGIVLGIRRMRAVESADWKAWEQLQEQMRLRAAWEMANENYEVDVAALRGDFARARAVMEPLRAASLSDKIPTAFRSWAFPALTSASLELRAYCSGEPSYFDEAELRRAIERLYGDRRLLAWSEGSLAANLAAQNKTEEALQLAQTLEAQWDSWSDDVTTQLSLSSYLGFTYLFARHFEAAIRWLERGQELEKRPAYFFSLRELLARAYFQTGNIERARELWHEVTQSGLELKAVELAQRALDAP